MSKPLASVEDAAKFRVELVCWPKGGFDKRSTGTIWIVRVGGRGPTPDRDDSCFRCPKSVPDGYKAGCGGLILPEQNVGGLFSCPSCGLTGPSEIVSERAMFVCGEQRLAALIEEYWRLCGGDADIHLKRFQKSIRPIAEAGRAGRHDEAKMLRVVADASKDRVLYPLRNLMKDNLSGTDMKARFLTFLRA